LADVTVAAKELAIARFNLRRTDVSRLLDETAPSAGPCPAELVERVRLAIPRASRRVPWRSDCLVQALAARRWLERHHVATRLFIGVRDPGRAKIDAHAWLTCGELTVTGGDVAPYARLEKSSPSRQSR
jgi:hypothetical protein